MEGAAGDAGRGLEFVGGASAWRCAQHRDRAFVVPVGERPQRGCLPGPGDAEHADDTLGTERGLQYELPLLVTVVRSDHVSVYGRRRALRVRGRAGVRLRPGVLVFTGELIRSARLRAGLSQAELAQRLGMASSSIARWETDTVEP